MLTPAEITAQRSNELDASHARVSESAYEAFKRAHGIPMPGTKELSGRSVLVAPDAWEWSDGDDVERGVPIPPPSDPDALRKQRLFYWQARRHFDEAELRDIDDELRAYRSEGEGHYGHVPTSGIDRMQARREWLMNDVELCDLLEHRLEHDIPLTWPCEHLSTCWWGDDQPYDPHWIFTEFSF